MCDSVVSLPLCFKCFVCTWAAMGVIEEPFVCVLSAEEGDAYRVTDHRQGLGHSLLSAGSAAPTPGWQPCRKQNSILCLICILVCLPLLMHIFIHTHTHTDL